MSKTLEDNKDKDKDKDKYTGLCEEEIVDGFAIFSFLTYTDLEKTVKEQEEALEDKNIVTNNNSNSKGKEIDGCNNKKTSNITGKSASSGGTVQRNRSKKNHSNNNNHKDGNNKESKKSSIVGKGLSGLTSTHHHLNHNHHNNTNHHHSKSIGKNKESKDKVNLNIHHHLNNSNNVKHNMSSSAGNKKQHVTSLTSSPDNGSSEVTSINGPGIITGHSNDKSEPEKARKQGRERDESSCLTGSNATSTASTNVISNTNNKDKLNLSKACHVNNINKNSVNLKHGNHSINKSKSSSTANNSNNSSTILSSTPSGKGKSSNKICHDKSSKIHDALSPVSGSSSLSSSSSSATTTTTTNIVTPIGTMSSVKHSLKSSSHVDKGCKASPPSKMKKKSQSMTDENHKKKLESIGDESESNRSIDGFKKSSKNPSSGGLKSNRGQQNNTESSKKSHKEVKSRKTSHSKDKDKSGQCKSNGHLKESKLFDQSKESQSKSYNGTTGLSTPSSSCRGRSPINTSSDEICDTKSVTIVAKRTKKRKLKERDKSSNNIKSESSYLKDCALNSGSNGNTGNSGIANHKDKHGALTHHYSISKSSSVPSDNLNPTVVLTATTTAISLNKGKHGLKASNSHLNDKSADCQPKKIKKKSISSPKSQENQKKQSKAVLSKTTSSNTSKASPSSSSSSSSSSSLSSLSSSSLSSSSSSLSSTNSTLSGVKSTPITCTPTALSASKVTSTANSISIQVDGESIGCESKFINDRENKPKLHSVKESVKKEKAESLISSVSKSIKLSSSSLFSSKLSMDNTLNPCMMEISCEKGSENCEKTSSSPSTTTTTTTIITTTTSTVKNQPERYSQSNLSSPSATPAKRRRTSSSTNDHSKPAKSNLNQEQKLDETINTNTNNGKSVGKNINNNNISNNKNTVNSNNTSSYDKHNDKSVSSNRQNNKVKSDNIESKSLAIITPVTTSDSVSTESTTFSTKVLNACDALEESQLSSVKPSKPVNPSVTDSTKSKVIATTTTTTTTTTKSSVLSSESSLETVTTNSTTMNVHCESKEDESKIDKNVNSIVIKEEMRSNQMDECDDDNVNDLKKQELCSSDSTDSTAINDTKCNSIIALSSSESSNGDSVNIEKLGPCSVPVSPSLPSKPPTTESSASSSFVSNEKCVYQTSPSMSDENLSKHGLTNIASKKCDPVNNNCNINCASSNTNSNSSDNSISSISKTIDTTNVSNSISDTNSNSKDQFSNVNPLMSTSVTKSSSKLSTSTPKMKPAEAAISFKLDNLLSGVPPSKSPFCVRSPNSSLMPSFKTPQPSSALTNNVFSMFTPPMQMNSTSFQKPGRWNTMHVRISWEILRQQKASQGDKSNTNSSSPLTITPSSRSFNLKSPTILPPSSSSASSISLPTLSKNSHLPYDLIRPPATNIFGDLRPGLQTPQSQSQQQNQPQPQSHPQPQPLHHQQNQSQPSTPHSRSLEISSFSASLMNAASGGLNSTPWNHRSPFGPVSLTSGHLPYPSLQAPSSSASSSTSSSIPQSLACSLPSSMSTSSTFSVSTPSITAPISSLGKINGNNDILRSSNSIFGLPPRPGEMTSFSTSLYNAAVAAAGHGLNRPNLEAWNSPFAPGPGMSSIAAHNFIRSSLPGFPGFPHPHSNPHSSHNNLGLPGSVPTSMSNNLFANLAPPKTPHSSASSISSSNIDSLMNTPGRPGSSIFPPLGREEHLPPISSSSGCGSVPGSGSSSSSSTSWGGLKAEAEKSESGKHKDGTSRNISRSKDEMRSAAHHQQQQHYHHQHRSSSNNSNSSSSNNNSKIVGSKHSSSSSNHNGDYESSHRRERDKNSNSQKREHSRPSSVSSVSSGNKMMKTSSSAFNDNRSSHINESKAKDDRKESMNNYNKYFDRSHKHSSNSIDHSHRDLKTASLLSSSIGVFNNSNSAILFSTASTASFNNSIMSIPTPPGLPPSITSGNNHSSAASLASMNLHVNNAMDHRARLMGLFGLSHGPPPPPSTPSLCHSMPPSPHGLPGHLSHPNPGSGIPSGLSHDFPKSFWSPFFQPHPGFHEFPPRNDFLEREHLLQQYNILNSSGGGAPLTEKLAKEGPLHALLEKESRDKEAAFASVFDKNRLASSSISTSTSSSTSSSVNAHHPHLRPGDTGLIAPNAPSLASPYGGPSSLVHGPGNLGLGHALPPPPLPPLSQSHPHSHASSSYHHQLQQHHLNQTSPGQSNPSSSSVLMFPPNPYLNSLHSLSASAGSNVRTDLNSRTKSLSSSSSPSSAPSIKQYPHHGASHSPSPMFIPPLNGLTGPHGFIPPPLVNSKLSTLDTSFEVNCVNRSTISMSNPSTPASGISLADLKESKSR